MHTTVVTKYFKNVKLKETSDNAITI